LISHNWQDTTNGILESLTGISVWYNVRVLWKARGYYGESLITNFFWLFLSIWRIYFYIHLDQQTSLIGEIPRMLANAAYFALMIYFGEKIVMYQESKR